MNPSSYVVGQGLAVVRPGLVVLVDDNGAVTPSALWALADRQPDVLALIDGLGVGHIAGLPAFAAVIWAEAEAHIVVRGSHSVQLIGTDGEPLAHLDGTGFSTWSEHNKPLDSISAIFVSNGTTPVNANELPIAAGVVKTSRILIGELPDTPTVDVDNDPVAVDAAAPEEVVEPGLSRTASSGNEQDPAHTDAHASAAEDEGDSVKSTASAPDLAPLLPPPPAPLSDASATLVEADDARYDAQWGATIAGQRPEDAAVRDLPEPSVEPQPVEAGDHDHHTMTPDQFARIRATRKASETTGEGASPRPVARLKVSTGKEVLVQGPVIIGRSPQVRNTSGGELPIPVVVDDSEQLVSGTHLEINVVGDGITATDVSRNGTDLEDGDGPRHAMTKNLPTVLADGSVLHLSDDIFVEVTLL